MARLRHNKTEGEGSKCGTEANDSKANSFISSLPHKMRVGLIAGLAIIGAAVAPIGCGRSESYNNCGNEPQQPAADAEVKTQVPCHIEGSIPPSLRGGGMLMFGSTMLVDANGAPVAKVVLGSKATPCDAIAAAYIAEAIALSTTRSKILTSQVEGTASCSANGPCDTCSCVPDMSGISSVIMPNNTGSVIVTEPYAFSTGALVILDTDATFLNTAVSVGNPAGNSVSEQLLAGTAVDWNATTKVVKEVVRGSKIIVAGAQASDTLSAAEDFVSQLKKVQ